ncbi:MAG: DNA polymerase III subunit alpha [Elusimicrobia bacterium]|nr:DNA polymerase III subunit alpha [Elusimicrobiota bacterium]
MTHSEFVHLHNHTEYSLLDGACALTDDKGKPSPLIQTIAKEFKMPALAITDHGNMYGAVEFYTVCREAGIKPIIGCEVYVAPGSRFDKKVERSDDWENYHHLTLLAKDFEGYQNLMQIVSVGFTEGFYYKPRVDKEILNKFSKGIIALSGCLAGEVASNLLKEKFDAAQKVAVDYNSIFGNGNFYLEIMDNGLEEQRRIIPHLIDLSKKLNIGLVATNDCHYLKKEDAYDHDVLLCIGTASTLDDPSRLRFSSDQFYYRPPEEMIKLFSYLPESIKNTLLISEKTALEIDFNQLYMPHYPVVEGETPEKFLEKLCRKGLKTRYSEPAEIPEKRLNYELSIINKMGFASYFLIVWDFIQFAKSQNISVGPGRGSGAGSIVAYSLGITDICPLRYGLLFERFLNPERRSMPDLDIDFADNGRDKVIEYVINKYGNKNCAQIITFGAMKARLVVRDVGRVMGFTPSETDRIAKMIPPMGSTIYTALQTIPELKNLAKSDDKIEKLLKTAQKLEGLKRHTGVHAAGMVIAKEEITKFSPLSRGAKDIITTQYDGTILPKLGLLKIDFLGLKTLTVIDETVEIINKTDPKFSIEKIDLEDKNTYQLFLEARTLGIFQVESKGMRDLIRKLQPTNIEDIIALVALYRPGPMGSGMLDDFVSRKHGRTKVKYDHPLLEPILKDTYGVILYQEQVMRIATDLAAFSAGQADGLRKAMGKKIPEEIEKQRENFINGAKNKGIEKRLAEKIFEQIVHFGGYGFNKSHAAAYGIISYRTAYLKSRYPLEFMAALLNSEIGHSAIGKDEEESKLATYLTDSEKMKIKILPPDIQFSEPRFSIENGNIRYGLTAIKNVGEGVAESITNSRKEKGPFKNWQDFIMRAYLHAANRKVLESLIKAGAFDSFGESYLFTRADLMTKLDKSLELAGSKNQDASIGQGLLFEMTEISDTKINGIKVDAWSEHDALSNEKEVLGFYLSGHPLTKHQQDLLCYSQYRLDRLPQGGADPRSSPLIRVAGIITNAKKLVSKAKNESYARFRLEDLNGQIDVVVFPSSYKNGLSKYIVPNNFVVVKGRLSGRDSGNELLAEEIMSIDEAKQKFAPYVGTIRLKISSAGLETETLENIKTIIKKYPGKSPVVLDVLVAANEEYSIETDLKVKYTDEFLKDIEKIIGPDSWEMETQQQL